MKAFRLYLFPVQAFFILEEMMKTVLSVAGSDCSGGAGIQADLKTFAALGVYGMAAVTSVVAENTVGVYKSQPVSGEILFLQLKAVFEDIFPDGMKIGMLETPELVFAAARALEEYSPQNIVADPVLSAKDGTPLMEERAIKAFRERILPKVSILTPNLPEAELLTGLPVKTREERLRCAERLLKLGAKGVLIKGGHDKGRASDLFYDREGYLWFEAQRLPGKPPHGTGCTLSSAIAAFLALGHDKREAVQRAKDYITGAIAHPLDLGKGNPPMNHFYERKEF